jgi:hypothetical protein
MSVGKDVEKLEHLYGAGKNGNWVSQHEKQSSGCDT